MACITQISIKETMKTRGSTPPSSGDNLEACAASEAAPEDTGATTAYKLSGRRWGLLAAITIYGFMNQMCSDMTVSILPIMLALLGLSLEKFIYLVQVFSYIGPIVALPGAWFVDRFGLRMAVYLLLALAAVRNSARALLYSPHSTPHWSDLRLVYWLTAGVAEGLCMVLYYNLPLLVSETWFPKEERSIAWSCLVASPSLGSALAQLTVPRLVHDVDDMHQLAFACLGSLAITGVAICLGVTRSRPREAPSERQQQQLKQAAQHKRRSGGGGGGGACGASASTSLQLRRLFSSPRLVVMMLMLASFDAVMVAINAVIQDVFAASGFTQVFCGQFLASTYIASAALQVFGAALAPDRTGVKGNTLLCKLYVTVQWFTFILYATTLCLKDYPNQQWWLMIVAVMAYTICRYWTAPAHNSLSAHLIAGHISEPTLSAAITVVYCVMTNLCSVCFVALRRTDPIQPGRPDYLYSVLFAAGVVSLVTMLYLTCFSGRRSLTADDSDDLEPVLPVSPAPSVLSIEAAAATAAAAGATGMASAQSAAVATVVCDIHSSSSYDNNGANK